MIFIQFQLKVQCGTDTFAINAVLAHLDFIQYRRVFFKIPAAAGFNVIRAELSVIPAQGQGNAQALFTVQLKGITCRDGQRRVGIFALLIVSRFRFCCGKGAFFIEGRNTFNVDGTANGIGIHVWSQRFSHSKRAEQSRWNNIQCNCTAASFWCWYLNTVDCYRIQFSADTADADEAAFALVTFNRKTRNTLQCFSGVSIREFTNGIGIDSTDGVIGKALALQCTLHTCCLTNNDNFVISIFFCR